MQQMFQQPEPPNKFNVFMEKFAWPTITLTVGSVLAAVIIAIWLGKIQVVDFSWVILILGCAMFGITAYFAWDNIRMRQKLQEQYNKDRAAIYTDYQQFKDNWQSYFDNERFRWDDWAINFSKKNMEEQNARHEELKRQCMEAIGDAENRLDASIKNALSIFSNSVKSYEIAVDLYRQQLIQTMKRMDALQEELRKESLPDSKL